jgi:uroporphyrinogen decarboxylase
MTAATPRERFLAALRRKPQSAPTGWMMRQAGRYLPEYQAARKNRSFVECMEDPVTAAEITLQPIRRFGMDAAVVFSDILVLPKAMGQNLEFLEGEGPRLSPPIRERADIERLKDFDPQAATGYLQTTLKHVRAELGMERAIVGFCGAPFTVASYMIEGGSSRNFERTKSWMYRDPSGFARLIERVIDNSLPYLAMQVQAGADALQLFDSWGGSLSLEQYRRFLAEPMRRMLAGARSTGAPVILYVNGGGHLLPLLVELGADCLSVDWRVDVPAVRALTHGRCALQGNLDPTILFADEGSVRVETERVLRSFAGHPGFIFNLGSGILPKTPVSNVAAAFEVLFGLRGAPA